MSVRRLAELADVSNPYLSQIERGLRKPSAEILQQVANALRVSVEQMYVRAGILPDVERTTSTVPEAIDGDPHLRPEQKLALRNALRYFPEELHEELAPEFAAEGVLETPEDAAEAEAASIGAVVDPARPVGGRRAARERWNDALGRIAG